MRNTVANPPTDEQMASVGSIEGKTPDQAAAHRIVVLRNTWQRMDTSWQHWQDQLGKVREARLWEFYPVEHPYGSLPDLLKANGIDPNSALRKDSFEGRYMNEDGTSKLGDGPGAPKGAVNNPNGNNQHAQDLDNYDVRHNYPRGEESEPKRNQGNSADYWEARLLRDAPEHHKRLQMKEYDSVAAACYDAGIRDKKVRLCVSEDPAAAGRYLAQRVDRQWMENMIDAYYKTLEKPA